MINENDLKIIASMLRECNRLIEICDRYNNETIINSFIFSDAVQYEFEKLYEDSTKLSKELQINPSLHIEDLRGIRNRIAHRYESVSLIILLDTI